MAGVYGEPRKVIETALSTLNIGDGTLNCLCVLAAQGVVNTIKLKYFEISVVAALLPNLNGD